jgi:hypothetical protein
MSAVDLAARFAWAADDAIISDLYEPQHYLTAPA